MIIGFIGSILASYKVRKIPVVEFQHSTINKRLSNFASWASVAIPKGDLTFTGVELSHAIIKADFLDNVNPLLPGIGFILQSHLIIDWKSTTLRLMPGGTGLLSDFVGTSFGGRVGQGLSILLANQHGYAYYAHLSSVLVNHGVSIIGPDGKQLRIADFVMENNANVRALLESKARFQQTNNCPNETKKDLKKALKFQVTPWLGALNPPATKSFAVISYVRDESRVRSDPSVLAFVDPDDDLDGGATQFSSADLRRENYAAWLMAMGLVGAAQRLLRRASDAPSPTSFIVFEIAGFEIAFPWFGPESGRWVSDLSWSSNKQNVMVLGLEVTVLEAIASSIRGDDTDLSQVAPLSARRVSDSENYSYSLFPDKTFLGNFDGRRMMTIRTVEL